MIKTSEEKCKNGAEPEYAVYIHHHPNNPQKKECGWEMKKTTKNRLIAMKKAEHLNKSGKYKMVEVKKKFFDQISQSPKDITLKILENNQNGRAHAKMLSVLLGLMITSFLLWIALLG